jgi:Malectin domain
MNLFFLFVALFWGSKPVEALKWSPITSFSLIDANSRGFIADIVDGEVLNLDRLPTRNLTIQVEAVNTTTGVRFRYGGIRHDEGSEPYVMAGKDGPSAFNVVHYLQTKGKKTIRIDIFNDTGVFQTEFLHLTIQDSLFTESFVPSFIGSSVPSSLLSDAPSGAPSDVPSDSPSGIQDAVAGEDSVTGLVPPAYAVFIDAGASDQDLSLVSGQSIESFTFDTFISGVPSTYNESIFHDHMSSRSGGFSYSIDGFLPNEEAAVTLGFAENYAPNCFTKKRLFSITVNGLPYATDLDVFSESGCNSALILSESFAADVNGTFVIDFIPVKRFPMVSFIEIVSASGIVSDAPSSVGISSVPSNLISDSPSFADISSVPSNAISDIPSSLPSDFPSAATGSLFITGLSMVGADTGVVLLEVRDGDSIDRSAIGTDSLTMIASTDEDIVESVRFSYDTNVTHTDGVPPYSMFGKVNGGKTFWPVSYLDTDGAKTVKIDAFDVTNKLIESITIAFTIV